MGKIRRLFLITAVVFAGFLVFSNTAQACQILDVFWGDESGVGNPVFGNTVKITASGTGCPNWDVSFQIWEDDLVGDYFVKNIPAKFDSGGGRARSQWRIGDGNKPDETSGTYQFYIKAIAGSSQKISNSLNISVPSGGGTWSGGGGTEPGPTSFVSFEIPNPIQATSLIDLAKAIGKFLLQIAIPIAVIIIIYAGILFLTSGGNQDRVKKARTALLYAVVGLAIILIGQGFFVLIKSILDLGGPAVP